MTLLLLHLNNSIVCFHYHLHFLWCLQRSQAQQQKFFTRKKQTFRWTKKCTSTLNKNRLLVCWAMSIVSNIICAITDIHCCFSSNTISCCATCFAQIEMFLIQCYNSTVSMGYPPTCNEAVTYLSTLENTLQNRPSWKYKLFYGLALTRIESKASLYSMRCTACKQTY